MVGKAILASAERKNIMLEKGSIQKRKEKLFSSFGESPKVEEKKYKADNSKINTKILIIHSIILT